MYKMIIIDDDILALQGLSEILKETNSDFTIENTFTNGKEALEYIKTHNVDVIISDIKMPTLDGLELAKICSTNYPHISIILLSAYSFFEYAQTALKYNVFRYILKPVDFDELSVVLEALKKELQAKKLPASKSFLPNSIFLERHQLFSSLLCGFISEKSMLSKSLSDIGINIDLNTDKCTIIYARINDFSNYIEHKWHHGRERLYTAISRLMPQDSSDMYCIFSRYSWNTLEFILMCKDNSDKFNDNIHLFCNTLQQNLLNNLTLEITIADSPEIYPNFFALLQNRFNLPINDVAQNHITNIIIPYINEHFSEPLTLKAVASLIPMNASYFSVYFKQITHENFIDYLTKIRMKEAKKLIETTNHSISNICNMVGYKNLSHFYQTFKKLYNDSPSAYRKQPTK